MKLSFIVPIYNVEPYLRKCVESLLHQDYEDYEIILVDDGSTDGSGQLADELVADVKCKMEDGICRIPPVKVIHQKNRGLSGARNSGLPVAKGEYICFVDSDDYWEENVLGGLMEQVERDVLDVLRFKWQNVRIVEDGRWKMKDGKCTFKYEVFKPYNEENFVDFSSGPLKGLDYLNRRMGIQCYAWSFIVKRDLCEQELFTEGILYEDTDWTPRMLVRAQRVAGTETIVYNYLWRENGITLSKSADKLKKEVENKIALAGRLKQWGDADWYTCMISALIVSVINLLGQQWYCARKKYLKQLKQIGVLPLVVQGLNKKAQRKVKLINISPTLAVWLIHIKNKQ